MDHTVKVLLCSLIVMQAITVASIWTEFGLTSMEHRAARIEIDRIDQNAQTATGLDEKVHMLDARVDKLLALSLKVSSQQIVNDANIKISHDTMENMAKHIPTTSPVTVPPVIDSTVSEKSQ